MRILVVGRLAPTILDWTFDPAEDGAEALQMLRLYEYDLVLTALNLPDYSATTLVTRARVFSDVPFIVVDADVRHSKIAELLRAGADDYVHHECSPLELEARIRARVRRANSRSTSVISCSGIDIEPETGVCRVNGAIVHLTKAESDILTYIMERRNQIVTKERMMDKLYGSRHEGDEPEQKILDVYVCKLRRKLREAGPVIETVWGRGWRITDSPPPALAATG